MSRYVNGAENPRFIIKSGETLIETIDLSLTNRSGLVETFQDFTIRKTLRSGKLKSIPKKKRTTFTLHYDELFVKSDGLSVARIINYEENGYRIFLMPRTDIKSRVLEVEYSGEAFSMGILTGGQSAPGNRLPILSWVTKELASINFVDPDDVLVVLEDFVII